MKFRSLACVLLLAAALPAFSMECMPQRLPAGSGTLGPWLDRGNWLAPGSLRATLRTPETFLPRTELAADPEAAPLRAALRPLDLGRLSAADPVDDRPRSLASLLDSRLHAEALVVLHNGRLLADQGWHEARTDRPRLLPQVGRPLLSLLGVLALGEGRLAGERAVVRYLPELAADAGLRRLSVQRLLEGNARFEWTAETLAEWQAVAGWTATAAPGDVRGWMSLGGRWDAPLRDQPAVLTVGGPEDDLLAWLLATANQQSLAEVFCRKLAVRIVPEQPMAWLTDATGHALGGGFVASPRDLARFGQWLIDSRLRPVRSRLPGWFTEALTAPAAGQGGEFPWLRGLPPASEPRYGFVRLGGRGSRVAIVGAHGNSLYVDFDRRLVIALAAAHPDVSSALQLATLQRVWDRIAAAVPAAGRR